MRSWHSAEGIEVRWYPLVDSTNDVARLWAVDGAADGSVVVADEQTAGRGRRGAVWVCPAGEGLAFSQILRPGMPRALWPRLALIAGLAAAKTLEKNAMAAEVKWPNDVLIGGKKVAGILVESIDDAVIVGVGLNVNVADFPEEIADTATSLLRETGLEQDRRILLEQLAQSIRSHASRAERDFPELLEQLRERCALSGKRVSLWLGNDAVMADVIGIGDRGELVVERDGRTEALMQADQIRIIR
jgi:BirA family biotin operon repressor/biotin-[acetyl-CoA-carboxylase] ligase